VKLTTANRNYSSWSLRPWVLLKMLDIPFEDEFVSFASCDNHDEFRKFSPNGKVPLLNVGARVRRAPDSPALARDIARIAEIFEEGLSRFGGPFLAGRAFTLADAFFAPVVFRIRTFGIEVGPLGTAWVERMLALEPMIEWEAAALAEPWREASHEADLAAAGSITADYRQPQGMIS
jgi:glutathione S-transferase